ncbi:MAG: transketolase-like TK C-terminal-containing protein, partial [Gammaproteobacteria bacterium]
GAGAILREVEAAAEGLAAEHGLTVEVFSVTGFTELARDVQDCARWNLLHPDLPPRLPHVAEALAGEAPVIAASDYMKALAEQLRPAIAAPYHVLGTDGFGRSDTREQLRHFFEVDRRFVTLAALKLLADQQKIALDVVRKARDALAVDPEKPNPRTV